MDFVTNALFAFNSAASKGLAQMLETAKTNGSDILSDIVMLVGLILVFYGAIVVFKALTTQQGGGAANWGKAALCLIIGGFMLFGGIKSLNGVSNIGKDTVQNVTGTSDMGVGKDKGAIHFELPTSTSHPDVK